MYTTSTAQADITGAQKEQYEIAKKAFEGQESALNTLYASKLPALEKEFEAAGGVLFNNAPARRGYYEE